ncbi:MAG: signal peptidase I [Candidatus Moraniibacteriota bacterium]|nr:MAG: signal peptidase I [Candidatus Moranbacteria bacterium]
MSFFLLYTLPFFLFWKIIQSLFSRRKTRSFQLKRFQSHPFLFYTFLLGYVFFCLFPIWLAGYVQATFWIQDTLDITKDEQSIAGTGSMFPTFPKGQGTDPILLSQQTVAVVPMLRYPSGFEFKGNDFFFRPIERGDIVTFSNEKTKEISQKNYTSLDGGFVKRVVALEGDRIEIRDGIFFRNGEAQKEPYVAKARSTFGGPFLQECQEIVIPKNKLFVMGDNRKGSNDSRFNLGFIDLSDIDHVLPYNKQKGVYDTFWHDPSYDLEETAKIFFDIEKYVQEINVRRISRGAKPLQYQPLLAKSASLRGKAILESGDFSFEEKENNYTMKQAMSDVGYSNIIWGESFTLGYYESTELIEHIFSFSDNEEFFFDDRKEEIGIAVIQGSLNGCPTQIIIQHVAGYIPPHYTLEIIEGWEKSLKGIKEIQPGWKNIDKNSSIYKENKKDIQRINEIMNTRIIHIQRILDRMKKNEWLTEEETKFIETQETLDKEQKNLAEKINKAVEKYNKELKEEIEKQRREWEESSR